MALTKKNFTTKIVNLLSEIQEKCIKLNKKMDPNAKTIELTDENSAEKSITFFGGRLKRLILPSLEVDTNRFIRIGVLGEEFALFKPNNETFYIGDFEENDYKEYIAELMWNGAIRDNSINNLNSLCQSIDTMNENDFEKITTKIGSLENFSDLHNKKIAKFTDEDE